MKKQNPATKSGEKSGSPKIKIRAKSVLPKNNLNCLLINEQLLSLQVVFQYVTFPLTNGAWHHLMVTYDIWYTMTTSNMFSKRVWFSENRAGYGFEASHPFTKRTRPFSEHRERDLRNTTCAGVFPTPRVSTSKTLRVPALTSSDHQLKRGIPDFLPNFGHANCTIPVSAFNTTSHALKLRCWRPSPCFSTSAFWQLDLTTLRNCFRINAKYFPSESCEYGPVANTQSWKTPCIECLCRTRQGWSENFLRAGRCGAQILPKKSRNTGDTRVWRWAIWNSHLWIFPGHLRSKKSLFPQWEPVFSEKCPKPTRKKTFLMSSWPFVALVLRIPWNTYKNSVLERVRLGSKAL